MAAPVKIICSCIDLSNFTVDFLYLEDWTYLFNDLTIKAIFNIACTSTMYQYLAPWLANIFRPVLRYTTNTVNMTCPFWWMSINNNPYDKTHTEESKYNHLIIISLTQKFSCRSFYFHSCLSCLVVTANMAVTIIM